MIQHIFITVFSCRGRFRQANKKRDPLRPERLDHRFELFEMGCLPGMLGQKNRDFIWILLVDPNLPEQYLRRLHNLLDGRINYAIHTLTEDTNVHSLSWLKPYIGTDTEYVLTTNIDDDDILYSGFTQYLRSHLDDLHESSQLPAIKFFGCTSVVQWDYFWSPVAPLGYTKPWKRMNSLPVSAGWSLLCKYPELDYSIFFLGHNLCEPFRNNEHRLASLTVSDRNCLNMKQEAIRQDSLDAGMDWDGILSPDKKFHYLNTDSPQAAAINHINNIQYMRIFEYPESRTVVDMDSSFLEISIDWDLASKGIKNHRRSFPLMLKTIGRAIVFVEHGIKSNIWTSMRKKTRRIIQAIKGVKNLR